MKNIDKIIPILGFANRANKLSMGRTPVLASLTTEKAYLVLFSVDASPTLIKKISHDCQKNVPNITLPLTKEELGQALGRKQIGVISVCDQQFTKSIKNLLSADE